MYKIARYDASQRDRWCVGVYDWWAGMSAYDKEGFGVFASAMTVTPGLLGIVFLFATLDEDYHAMWWHSLFFVPALIAILLMLSGGRGAKKSIPSNNYAGKITTAYNQLSKQNKRAAKPLVDRVYALSVATNAGDYLDGMNERLLLVEAMVEKQRGVERANGRVTFDDSDIESARFYVENMYTDTKSLN